MTLTARRPDRPAAPGLHQQRRLLRRRDRRRPRAVRLRADAVHAGAEGGPRRAWARARRHPAPAPLPHPLRPRRRRRRARARAPVAAGARLGRRRAASGRPEPARGERAPALRRHVRPALGRARPVPAENIRSSATTCSGSSASRAPGHASHHVSMLHEDGTLYAGDSVGRPHRAGELRARPTPPPDIDLEAWEQTIVETERREPARLALTHFGVFEDVPEHLARLRATLQRWGGARRPRHGRGDVRRRRPGRLLRLRPGRGRGVRPGRPVLPSASSGSSATGASGVNRLRSALRAASAPQLPASLLRPRRLVRGLRHGAGGPRVRGARPRRLANRPRPRAGARDPAAGLLPPRRRRHRRPAAAPPRDGCVESRGRPRAGGLGLPPHLGERRDLAARSDRARPRRRRLVLLPGLAGDHARRPSRPKTCSPPMRCSGWR